MGCPRAAKLTRMNIISDLIGTAVDLDLVPEYSRLVMYNWDELWL